MCNSFVLLSTALVQVVDHHGGSRLCRVLLDSASQSHSISERVVRKLGLPLFSVSVEVCGIGQSSTKTSSTVQCVIKSRFSPYTATIQCVVLKSITQQLPTVFIPKSDLEIPSNLQLADPHYNQPSEIDLLVVAELFFDLLLDGRSVSYTHLLRFVFAPASQSAVSSFRYVRVVHMLD